MPSVPAAAPIRFCLPLTILKPPWVGVECLLHLSSTQLLFTEDFSKEQWDPHPISGVIFNFLLFPNLLSFKCLPPMYKYVPFSKGERPNVMCCDSCDFSGSWIFSFSPVVNTRSAWCFSLAKSRACPAELPLGPAHPPLSYCSAVTPQDSSPSCCFPGSSSSPTASAHPRGGCPSPCLYGPWTNPAEFLP